MKWPELVPDSVCKTPIHVIIDQEGISEEGEPLKALEANLMCNYQDSAYRTLNEQQKLIVLSGKAYFNGDIAPSIPVISGGEVIVFGVKRRIHKGTKARNLDGTVNYSLLEII